MLAIQRFNLAVSAATVSVMFFVIEYLVPMLQASTIPTFLSRFIPFVTPALFVEASKFLVTALVTLGTYKSLAAILISRSIGLLVSSRLFLVHPTSKGRGSADFRVTISRNGQLSISNKTSTGSSYGDGRIVKMEPYTLNGGPMRRQSMNFEVF